MLSQPRLLGFVAATAAMAFAGTSLTACDQGGLKGAEAEVEKTAIKLELPQVPEFDIPKSEGEHRSVQEMRLKGNKLLDTEVQVKGHVVWIYDCVEELMTGDKTEKEVKKLIEEDPTRCQRPHFILGDEADTPADRGIWVVEYPRELRKDEKKGMTREDLANYIVYEFEVGDEVVAFGKWSLTSPRGFANSNGLLVFSSLKNLTKEAAEAADDKS